MLIRSTLRRLALAAALMAPMVAGAAHAETGASPFGPSASGRWVGTDSRTPLASSPSADAAQSSLQGSGATGGGGQHS